MTYHVIISMGELVFYRKKGHDFCIMLPNVSSVGSGWCKHLFRCVNVHSSLGSKILSIYLFTISRNDQSSTSRLLKNRSALNEQLTITSSLFVVVCQKLAKWISNQMLWYWCTSIRVFGCKTWKRLHPLTRSEQVYTAVYLYLCPGWWICWTFTSRLSPIEATPASHWNFLWIAFAREAAKGPLDWNLLCTAQKLKLISIDEI